jgi:dihydroorotate dehydrogenase (fumarate)
MVDLTTSYMGFHLKNPVVASASPLTGTLDGLRRVEDAGAAAAVLPSLFEEQIVHDSLATAELIDGPSEIFAEAMTYWPEIEDYNTGPEGYLHLISSAKVALGIPVIASLNGSSPGGWTHYARLLQQAGADAIELNVYFLATDLETTASEIELRYVDLVEAVRAEVSVPLAVKIGPYFNAPAHMASLIDRAGADALVLFNRFYQPDFDLEDRSVVTKLVLSTSEELRLPLHWIAILFGGIQASLAATTGVHTHEDALKVVAAGADVAMMTSALLRHGPGQVGTVLNGMQTWLEGHDYRSIDELRGSMSYKAVGSDAGPFERANYVRTLTSYPAPRDFS